MILRVEKLRKKMQEENLDSFLVTSPYNLRYLTNFTGTAGLAVITLGKAFFITDFRYAEQAAAQAQGFEITKNVRPIFDEVANLTRKKELHSLAFEETTVSLLGYSVLEEIIDAELVPVSQMIEEFKEVKDKEEIAAIEKAYHIADMIYDHILKMAQPGMTRTEIVNQLGLYMHSLDTSGVSFGTTVASGLRSTMPHGVTSKKIIEQGDLITLDFGYYYEGYASDMIRTFAIGSPGGKLKEVYQIVLNAQLAVIDTAEPGMTSVQLDAVARDYISKHGCGEAFRHSAGHGVGLKIREGPNISSHAEKQLVPRNMITDEPGIYLPGIDGVRTEGDLLITEDGNRVLARSPKELTILQFHQWKK